MHRACAAVQCSRRLVEHNRSPSHEPFYTEAVRRLREAEQSAVLMRFYDPTRALEAALCPALVEWLAARTGLHVRGNYPYRGTNDRLTAYLRKLHAPERYVGVEIEINQKHVHAGAASWQALQAAVVESIAALP